MKLVGGDGGGLGADCFHRTQRSADDDPRGHADHDEQQRQAEHEDRREAANARVHGAETGGDEHRVGGPRNVDTACHEQERTVSNRQTVSLT